MRLTSSYNMKLTGDLKALETSIGIYRQALSYLIPIIDNGWDTVSSCNTSKHKINMIEKWIHSTKVNQARFDFDEQFPKLPSYLRRSAISKALGIVSSYRSNLENWKEDPKGQAPKLSLTHYAYPAYYDTARTREADDRRRKTHLRMVHKLGHTRISIRLEATTRAGCFVFELQSCDRKTHTTPKNHDHRTTVYIRFTSLGVESNTARN